MIRSWGDNWDNSHTVLGMLAGGDHKSIVLRGIEWKRKMFILDPEDFGKNSCYLHAFQNLKRGCWLCHADNNSKKQVNHKNG